MNRNIGKRILFPCLILIFLIISAFGAARAQNVKRVVIVKVDGLSADYLDKYVRQKDEKTGKSVLPWFDEIFYKNGTRLSNFYTRGMSLSASSWSLLDTGQNLRIKGNVEYNRIIPQSFYYLNFIPYYVDYGMKKRVDMPGMEVLDQLEVPILSDAFPYERRYTSFQLLQRGTDWGVFASGFLNLFPKNSADFIDEWTIGFDFHNTTFNQQERDIIKKIESHPEIEYFDYFTPDFDHVAHLDKSPEAHFTVLQKLDRSLGRFWVAIEKSKNRDETALILVSDHGINTNEKVYSQGFNIIKFLQSRAGGGHHVATKQQLMRKYSIKGLNPFVSIISNESKESFYLAKQAKSYPTIKIDFDGNERASLHLRDSDLNILQMIFQELQKRKISKENEKALKNAFFKILNRRRAGWQKTLENLNQELEALNRWIKIQEKVIEVQPNGFSPEQISKGEDKESRRIAVQAELARKDEAEYRQYLKTLNNLLALRIEDFNPKRLNIKGLIAEGAMGERNSIYQLQNYAVGLSKSGFVFTENGDLDFERSFERVNYFDLFTSQMARSNVQKEVSSSPIDFVAAQIPLEEISNELPKNLQPDQNPVWIYGSKEKQALIFTRKNADSTNSYFYLPIANLKQNAAGKFSFEIKTWSAGFPLKIFEDENFAVENSAKKEWLSDWQSETEWLRAAHKTEYSAAVINLCEQFNDHLSENYIAGETLSEDEKLLRRYRIHQRRLTETDLLVLANNLWNFDVRGFNAGGNHGSFFRISSNSALMFAGGTKTGIPRGLNIVEPYDNLSFVPTVFALMNKIDGENLPSEDLRKKGFQKFPGRVIKEMLGN